MRSIPAVAVSPIVAGRAIKGPLAKVMAELGLQPTAVAVATHYKGLIDGFVIDEEDADSAPAIERLGIACHVAQTVMHTLEDRSRLASEVLDFIARIR